VPGNWRRSPGSRCTKSDAGSETTQSTSQEGEHEQLEAAQEYKYSQWGSQHAHRADFIVHPSDSQVSTTLPLQLHLTDSSCRDQKHHP
jgi:hypothetical protein